MLLFSIPFLGFAALVVLAVYKFIIYPSLISPLAKVPNAHWTAPFSPLWILWIRYSTLENASLHAAHTKLGPIIRVGPSELSVNDLGGVRSVYTGGMEKGEWYSIFDNYGVPCMFSTWNSKPHSLRKRMVSNSYSKSYIQGSPAVERQTEIVLYDRLLPIINSSLGTSIDVLDLYFATTMDGITAFLFGTKSASNFLQNEKYRKHWLGLYYFRKKYTFFSQELPRLTRFLKNFHIRLVPAWVDDANQELEDWCMSRCDASKEFLESAAAKVSDRANDPVVLNAILKGIEKEDSSKGTQSILAQETLKYPKLSIASEMIDHLAAGHETSGITLTYLSWYLSQDLPLQAALRKELLTLSPNMLLSNSTPGMPSPKDLDALPLLHAVIQETLRLRASIPGNQPRMTPYPSCTIGEYQIPGGVRIGAQAHSVHRNPDVYPEPEKWDYKRWLDGENGYTEEQSRERDRWFWAFSSGGRMCIGSNFAMHEMKMVTAAIYTNFTTHIVDDEGIEQGDGYTCGPIGNKLILRFEKASDI